MAILQGQCTVFKTNLLKGLENFAVGTPYVYKIALYNTLATLNQSTTAYSTSGEVVGTGYIAGGKTLTVIPPAGDTQSNTAYVSFANVNWNPASFVASAALIYNATTGAAVAVLDFGGIKTSNPSTGFTITFPADTPTTAVLRIS